MSDKPYTGRRWRFDEMTGTVCSEPFSLTLGQANGNRLLDGEMTHGCVAVSLDVPHRATHRVDDAGTLIYLGTIIGHIDDVETP